MTVKAQAVPFEVALSMTGYSKYNLLVFLLVGSIIMGMAFEMFSVSYLVPASACELGTTGAQQGLMASMPLAGVIVASHIWGYLADTRGRKQTLIISMTMGFIAGIAAAFSPNWIVLSVFKFISSASVAGAYALSVTLLSECTPIDKRTFMLLLSTTVFLSSTGTMAVITIPVLPLSFSYYIPYLNIHFNSWRLLGLIFAVPCAMAAVGVACAYESPKYLLSVGREKEALEVLKGIYVMNHGHSLENFKVESLVLEEDTSSSLKKNFWQSVAYQTLPMLKPPLLKYTILLSLLFVINYMCMTSFQVWMPFMVNAFVSSISDEGSMTICEMIRQTANSTTTHNVDECILDSNAMIAVFSMSVTVAALNIMMSGVLKCIGRKKLFIGLQLIGGIACLSLNFIRIWVLTAIFFVIFMSGTINFGFLSTFCVDVFPTYVRAMAVSLTLMVGRGSAVFGINLLKNMLDNNCEAAMYTFGSIAFAGGIIGILLPSDATIMGKKKNTKP